MKKIISALTIVAMLLTTPMYGFAVEREKAVDASAEKTVSESLEIASDMLAEDNIINDIIEKDGEFLIEDDEQTVRIPTSGLGEIEMAVGEEEYIAMGLPEEIKDSAGLLTDTGAIVYDSDEEDVSVTVENLGDESEGYIGTRAMLNIENAEAPKEYKFVYDLPAGYSLVKDYDYDEGDGIEDAGAVYTLNENEEIVNTIESAWAIDADGNTVDTHYEIEGNTLKQIVEFNESTAFPIIADPTNNPNITRTAKLSKSETYKVVKKIQSEIDDINNFSKSPGYWIITEAAGFFFGRYVVAAKAITDWIVKPTVLKKLKARKKLYKDKYNKMTKKDKLKVVTVLKWKRHGSHDGCYAIYSEKLSIL